MFFIMRSTTVIIETESNYYNKNSKIFDIIPKTFNKVPKSGSKLLFLLLQSFSFPPHRIAGNIKKNLVK